MANRKPACKGREPALYVACYDTNGNRVDAYQTVRCAAVARSAVGASERDIVSARNGIHTACRKPHLHALGLRWRSALLPYRLPQRIDAEPAVAAYDADGYLIGTFPTRIAAGRHCKQIERDAGRPQGKRRPAGYTFVPLPAGQPADGFYVAKKTRQSSVGGGYRQSGKPEPVIVEYANGRCVGFRSMRAAGDAHGVSSRVIYDRVESSKPLADGGKVRRLTPDELVQFEADVEAERAARFAETEQHVYAEQLTKAEDRRARAVERIARERARIAAERATLVHVRDNLRGNVEETHAVVRLQSDGAAPVAPVDPFASAFGAVCSDGIAGTVVRRSVRYK